MRAFWNTVEKLDDLAFRALDSLDQKRDRGTYRKRMEEATKDIRAPQRVIEFEK